MSLTRYLNFLQILPVESGYIVRRRPVQATAGAWPTLKPVLNPVFFSRINQQTACLAGKDFSLRDQKLLIRDSSLT
jgi:hypothetical protein